MTGYAAMSQGNGLSRRLSRWRALIVASYGTTEAKNSMLWATGYFGSPPLSRATVRVLLKPQPEKKRKRNVSSDFALRRRPATSYDAYKATRA